MKLLQNISLCICLLTALFIINSCRVYSMKRNKGKPKTIDTTLKIGGPNPLSFSHEDSLFQQKMHEYDNIRNYYFLFKNELISDSLLRVLHNNGTRVEDGLIQQPYATYWEKIWKLEKINKDAYNYYFLNIKRSPYQYELDSILNR